MRDLIAGMDSLAIAALGGGEAATYTSGDLISATVTGIFDAYYQNPGEGEMGAAMHTPAFFTTLAQLTSDPAADADAVLEIDGVAYSVREPKPDGQGAVLLMLHKVDP